MINLAQIQTLDYAAFGAAMVGLLGTIIGMIVWMVKLSAKRSQDITDGFIKHLEVASSAKAREDVERAAERAEFLNAINQHTQAMGRMADQQKEVAERLSDVVTKVSELASTVARIEEQQERFSREST
jgi:uncharacterized membrane-anchored protein YhcB (DUF1043 family)